MTVNDCPRCKSLLRFGSDFHGKFYSCIQCGYYKDIITIVVVPDSLKGHQKTGRKRPNRIADVDNFLNQDRQVRQIAKREII